MELVRADEKDKKIFIKFYEDRYLNDPLKRNSMSSTLKALLSGKSQMCKSVDLEQLMVVEDGRIIMICVLAHAHRMSDILQISFFEAIENSDEGFKLILNRAVEKAKEKGAKRISGSLNIHVNYGLGFLADDYNISQGFGTPHNPPYYNTLFENEGFEKIQMVSFQKNMKEMESMFHPRIKDRLNRRYKVRGVDFKNLKREAEIYTEINNKAFTDHIFYYERKPEEDLELFREFKYLLKSENLLFVERDGEPVGFMLWYPDFHALMSPKESMGVKTVIKSALFPDKMNTFKIVEIGIIPEERDKGAIMALFEHCYSCTKDRYDTFESGWVLTQNRKSYALGDKLSDGIYKKYNAFIKDLDS